MPQSSIIRGRWWCCRFIFGLCSTGNASKLTTAALEVHLDFKEDTAEQKEEDDEFEPVCTDPRAN